MHISWAYHCPPLIVPVYFTDNTKCQFGIVWYGFPLIMLFCIFETPWIYCGKVSYTVICYKAENMYSYKQSIMATSLSVHWLFGCTLWLFICTLRSNWIHVEKFLAQCNPVYKRSTAIKWRPPYVHTFQCVIDFGMHSNTGMPAWARSDTGMPGAIFSCNV